MVFLLKLFDARKVGYTHSGDLGSAHTGVCGLIMHSLPLMMILQFKLYDAREDGYK